MTPTKVQARERISTNQPTKIRHYSWIKYKKCSLTVLEYFKWQTKHREYRITSYPVENDDAAAVFLCWLLLYLLYEFIIAGWMNVPRRHHSCTTSAGETMKQSPIIRMEQRTNYSNLWHTHTDLSAIFECILISDFIQFTSTSQKKNKRIQYQFAWIVLSSMIAAQKECNFQLILYNF